MVLALQGAITAHAQVTNDPTPVRTRAINLTRILATNIKLNEGQYVKVKQINERMLVEIEEVKSRYATDQVAKDQHLAEIQARYDVAMEAVLQPAQIALYQQSRTSMTALSTATK